MRTLQTFFDNLSFIFSGDLTHKAGKLCQFVEISDVRPAVAKLHAFNVSNTGLNGQVMDDLCFFVHPSPANSFVDPTSVLINAFCPATGRS